jgi:hypothetical protein
MEGSHVSERSVNTGSPVRHSRGSQGHAWQDAEVKEDKTTALDLFNKGEGGFKNRDLYVFCANASDGILTAHPALKGELLTDIKDKDGQCYGAGEPVVVVNHGNGD